MGSGWLVRVASQQGEVLGEALLYWQGVKVQDIGRKANKHWPLNQACQPPNTHINHTYTMHIFFTWLFLLWLPDPEMKAIQSFQMSQIIFHQCGLHYTAEDQNFLYVHLITFLLQECKHSHLRTTSLLFLLPCYMKSKVTWQKTHFLCYYETFMTKINYLIKCTDHYPHSGCTIHSSFIILKSSHTNSA